ncbi:MAG: hypothetical protein NT166_28980 [Candidatus Aminicenantes bacterium]|nr:hypothetical protein [Candidatus Aminicenantes bacterium]
METHSLLRLDDLKEYFKDKTVFTINDLRQYYQRIDTSFNESAFKWKIHAIQKKEFLRTVKRGVYTFQSGSRLLYQPGISSRLKKKYKEIKKEFPYTGCCIWETLWLNELMNHQPGHFMDLLEVENEAAQSVFYFLQQQDEKDKIYFKPSDKEIEQYIASNRQSTIIRTLLTQAPTQEQEGIRIPKLEKILVDLFIDRSLFIAYQGQELITIFKNAYRQFPVNISTLFRYAQRRKKKDQLTDFILKNEIIPGELID